MNKILCDRTDLVSIADAVRSKTNTTKDLSIREIVIGINNITTGSSDSAEGCVTVAFMNKSVELLSRPVYIGDDCPDPVEQGRIDRPTKESTVDTVYSHNGWTSDDGGTADDTVLANITEDKTVYAAFKSDVRTYTVRFFDGNSLVHTEQVAYGGSSDYIYHKNNLTFYEWNPKPIEITSDLDCYGEWIDIPNFATSDWDIIKTISQNGQAAEVFHVGDERAITLTYDDGSTEEMIIQIAGFNQVYTDYESKQTAGIVMIAKNVLNQPRRMGARDMTPYDFCSGYKGNCELYNWMQNELYNALPIGFANIIKPIWYYTSIAFEGGTVVQTPRYAKILLPSHQNIFGTAWIYNKTNGYIIEEPDDYYFTIFENTSNRIRYDGTGEARPYWTRTNNQFSNGKNVCVRASGQSDSYSSFNLNSSGVYVCPVFAI